MYNMSNNHISLGGAVTIGPKGQVVIPAALREKMQVGPGDKLIALYIEDKKAVAFITEEAAKDMIQKMGEHVSALQTVLK